MAGIALAAGLIAGLGASYQLAVAPFLSQVGGVGREIVEINNGANCQVYTELAGCEDFWLHQPSGLLYAVCSDPDTRRFWLPAALNLDEKKRPKGDAVYILDTKSSQPGNAKITKVKTPGFSGVNGDGTLNLHGIGVYVLPSTAAADEPTLRLFINNHRPTLGDDGIPVDNSKMGANSTIEIFQTKLGSDEMEHIKTHAEPLIRTPNRVAPVSSDSFLFTNDHRFKTNHARDLVDAIFPVSDVGYCDPAGCHVALSNLAFPNGLVNTAVPDYYIVPSTSRASQYLVHLDPATKKLSMVTKIPVGFPTDNLGLAANGDVYTASFGTLISTFPLLSTPADDPSHGYTVVRRIPAADIAAKGANGWHVETVFGDNGSKINGATGALFDTDANTLYVTGIKAKGIVACKLP